MQSIFRTSVLGVPLSLVDLARATAQILEWAKKDRGPYSVFVREVAGLMLTVRQPELLNLHESADLVVADGIPLVWVARFKGHGDEIGRVAGADLVDAVCRHSIASGQSHFFYGGKPGVAQRMAQALSRKYPGLKVAGTYSPPMLDIGPDFDLIGTCREDVEVIRASKADLIWVGISSPKQEYWIAKAMDAIDRGVFIGVGAAFDFHSGSKQRAPAWMRNNGLEWLHRLMSEPRRLWRRYLILAPIFAVRAFVELIMRSRQRSG
ncbi:MULTISPECIES: WecB/TagA/CpsF family glycosyltransferase [unclassified Bradyrhizobium]|uniref:WecB/TagA/CpsF family glycosyltransferase n=1 Tax=unclassified Bradyrhizobium TaxID=2631580 RepID=UPI001CD6FDCA|nr:MULTISPECIES: WecB/TagA/CpsF family glycosyltransferase [unclassified Bradyrhizobium]MCA1495222.1 WecB/TagA/CpsF family glycosyltransferase [Bradyrhizobium sp. NBAIM14]MCA1531030.1 WecB/TagA/CpsF family glycosyltransferase [Bradyrhizobium sp. NBAIM03]